MRTKRTFALSLFMLVVFVSTLAGAGYAGLPFTHKKHSGIAWGYNLDEGLAKAKKESKPVMVDFMAVWCPPCKAMEDSTFSDAAVIGKSAAFVPVRIDIDKQHAVAAKCNGLARKYGGIGIPNILFMAPDGTALKHIVGYYSPKQLIAAMDSALAAPK
ncbi:MAG: thioredoxin family protein [Candidatus Krumholzibacteriaceae bacterium]